jgi:hypothetical protein
MVRRVLIGVIGGDKQRKAAWELGKAAAAAEVILQTGGGDPESMRREPDEAKNAVIQGAYDTEAARLGIARIIGIVPSANVRWFRPQTRRCLLYGGLPHNQRNVINGVTPDVLIVMGGSRGPLAEAAFGLAAGKKLFFYTDSPDGGVKRLRRNFLEHLKECNDDCRTFLHQPLSVFPEAWPSPPTPHGLKAGLEQALAEASDWSGSQAELIAACVAAAGGETQAKPTWFPGLPDDPSSKQRFEALLSEISQ